MYTPIQSLFFRALEMQFHWSRGAIAGSLIALPITALFLPLVGPIIDRLGVRRVALVSAVLLALSFIWLSTLQNSLISFYAAFIAFNVLGSATGPIAYTRPVATSFFGSRGTAMAIAISGIALSGVLLPPLLGPLLAKGYWREGYQAIAALAFIGGVIAVALIKAPGQRQAAQDAPGLLRREVIRTPAFWLLGIAIFAVAAASVGFVSQLQSIAFEFGVPLNQTAFILSATALSTLPSRLLSGWALDRMQPELVAAAFILVSGIGQLIWFMAPGTFLYAIGAAILLGVSLGAEHAFIAFFCARLFGLRAYSSNFGALAVFLYFGMAGGGMFFAATHDRTGSYTLATAIAVGLMVLSAVLFFKLPRTATGAAISPKG